MKKLMLAALLSVAVAGCGESDEPKSNVYIGGEVSGAPAWRLPGEIYALKGAMDSKAQSGRAWWIDKSEWKPKGWSIWIAANVYSDYKAPNNDLTLVGHGFPRALSAVDRADQDGRFIGGVSKWLKTNKVNIEVNYLGYDNVPGSLAKTQQAEKGFYLSFNNQPCDKAFRLCVDNYFISPAARRSGGRQLSFKEWLMPYLSYSEGASGLAEKAAVDYMGGTEDEQSKFFDYWPTMVFLVNPDGKVVRAWLPQKGSAANVQVIEASIVNDIGGPYKKLPVTDSITTSTPSLSGYYGEYYVETGVGKMMDTFKEIMEAK